MGARFEPAFARTLGHEGGYSNDPHDRGGETFLGITRRDHPDWPGWQVIGDDHDAAALTTRMPQLRELAGRLYRSRYWDRFDGDSIPSQAVAEELFDTAVNMGVGRAVTFLQRALNALNRNGQSWPDISADGDMGPATRAALALCLSRHDEKHLLRTMNVLQGAFYVELARRDPTQEAFLRGWLNRVFDAA